MDFYINIPKPSFFEKDFFTNIQEIKFVFNDIINGSCMAMVINDEVIWNEYDNFLKYNERFQQNIIREYLCNNIDVLFNELLVKNINTRFYFYLYKENPLLIIVFYDATDKTFILKFFK